MLRSWKASWEVVLRRGVLNFVGHVPSWVSWVWCHCVIVPLCHQVFSLGYFVGPNFFLVGILWVQNFSSWVWGGSKIFSRGSKIFSCGYDVGPKFFLVGISWVQYFWSWLISRFKDFQLLVSWERVTGNRNTWIHLKPHIVFQIDFNSFQFCSH